MLAGQVSRFVVRRTLALSLVLVAGSVHAQVPPASAPPPAAQDPAAPPPPPAPAPAAPPAPPAAPPPSPPAPPVVSDAAPVAPAPPPPPAAPVAPAPAAPPPTSAPTPPAAPPAVAPVPVAPVAPVYAPVAPVPAPGAYAPAPQAAPPAYAPPAAAPAYAQPAPYAAHAPYPAPAPYPYAGAPPYPQPALPPGYVLPPPAFPISDLPYAQQSAPAPKPRNYPRRLLLELGGTVHYGTVQHRVDGEFIETHGDSYSDHTLHGAFDFRLGLQRRFGRWFALAGQFAWSNWQSDFLNSTHRRRSNYVGLVVQPEVRIPFGRCRGCPSLFFAPRVGLGLSMRGDDSRHHSALEEVNVGSAFLYGMRGGLEFPFGPRVSLRLSTGFEAVWLRNRVEYAGLGSELSTIRVERPSTMLGFSIGLGDGT
ncbi:MAG TPA: hypothetical protein VFZ61_01585 [Polyangiales bacterium]